VSIREGKAIAEKAVTRTVKVVKVDLGVLA